METPEIWFRTICRKNGLLVSNAQLSLLSHYVDLLLGWNLKVNLISRKDTENVWQRHILLSASILFKLIVPQNARIVDIGTGGGLPGIPLKILRPDLNFTLLDSTQKKVVAVAEMLKKLGLPEIEAVWARAEEAPKLGFRHGFDFAVARAVAPLVDLVKWTQQLVRQGMAGDSMPQVSGVIPQKRRELRPPALVVLKGGDLEKEIGQARRNVNLKSLHLINLVFDGSEQIQTFEKKLVVLQF